MKVLLSVLLCIFIFSIAYIAIMFIAIAESVTEEELYKLNKENNKNKEYGKEKADQCTTTEEN